MQREQAAQLNTLQTQLASAETRHQTRQAAMHNAMSSFQVRAADQLRAEKVSAAKLIDQKDMEIHCLRLQAKQRTIPASLAMRSITNLGAPQREKKQQQL
jgi:hypothetical protein